MTLTMLGVFLAHVLLGLPLFIAFGRLPIR